MPSSGKALMKLKSYIKINFSGLSNFKFEVRPRCLPFTQSVLETSR